jgi:hypothetical protein
MRGVVIRPPTQCLPKDRVILIMCNFSFCVNFEIPEKRKWPLIVCGQLRHTRSFQLGGSIGLQAKMVEEDSGK